MRLLEDRGADEQVLARCAAFDQSAPPAATPVQRYWARVHLAAALGRLGRSGEARAVHARTLVLLGAEPTPDPAVVQLVAEARLEHLAPALDRYRAQRIGGAGPGASKTAQEQLPAGPYLASAGRSDRPAYATGLGGVDGSEAAD